MALAPLYLLPLLELLSSSKNSVLFLITLKGRKGGSGPCMSGSTQLLTLLHGVITTAWSRLVTFMLTSCLSAILTILDPFKAAEFFFKEGQYYLPRVILGQCCSTYVVPAILEAFPPAESQAIHLTEVTLPLYLLRANTEPG